MRIHLFLLLFALPVLSLPACGNGESDDPAPVTFADDMEALEKGDAAVARKDFGVARQAYSFAALEGSSDAVKASATEKLVRACAQGNDTIAALGSLETLKSDHPATLDTAKLTELAEFMVTVAKNPDLCEFLIDTAKELGATDFREEHFRNTVTAMRSGDTEAMAALGYVGD